MRGRRLGGQVARRGDESRGAECLKWTYAGAQEVRDSHGRREWAGMYGRGRYRAIQGSIEVAQDGAGPSLLVRCWR